MREKVQEVPSLCLCSTVHSRDVPSEPVEAPVPGCNSGRDGGTGSTTMSKSDTFQGPGGFRTPSAPGRVSPTPHPVKQRHDKDRTAQTHERGGEKRKGITVYTAHEEKGVREEGKGKSQKSSPGKELTEKSGRKETNSWGPGGNFSHKVFMQDL